jgi:pyruvate kinase
MPDTPFEIIATIGPASRNLVSEIRDAGASAFRLNASHMSSGEVVRAVQDCARIAPGMPIAVDLQGAKMRLGAFEPAQVREGDQVRFSLSGSEGIPLPHRELFLTVAAGDTVSCDDDRLHFRIRSVHDGVLETEALSSGRVLPRKGVNVLEHPVELAGLTDSDVDVIRLTRQEPGVSYAFSFMKDGGEAEWVRAVAPTSGIAGKIERREATENAVVIAGRVDSLWICRGDLGAQLGIAEMARRVAGFAPRDHGCPVLMAGQVAEHLTAHKDLTRSEACHLYDLRLRGYRGVVLSDETAIGIDPVNAVRTVRDLVASFRN